MSDLRGRQDVPVIRKMVAREVVLTRSMLRDTNWDRIMFAKCFHGLPVSGFLGALPVSQRRPTKCCGSGSCNLQ